MIPGTSLRTENFGRQRSVELHYVLQILEDVVK